jgi:soluble lytic murein transglycosylase-like protein
MAVLRTVFLLVLASAIWPARADAQIYAWRDASGTLVLSDRVIDAPTAVHEVIGAPQLLATRPVESPIALARFEPLVVEHATRHAIRPELVRAVIQVESGFNPLARSPKGAMGLMQLMPRTAQELGVADPYDPAQNIRGGTAYLRQLLDRYDGNEELALAAYNAGAGAVDRHGRSVPPFRETRAYVKKVVGNAGSSSTSIRARLVIYKSIEIIDGRVVPRYSSAPPPAGTFERIER